MKFNESHREPSDVFWGEMSPCEHLVQIYQNDAVLLDTLEGFVAGGLRAGEGVIVIASPAHIEALEDRLEAQKLDLAAARADDRFIALDAEQTLSKFMVNGWPDSELFEEVVTGVLERARGESRRVRAFGEMVAVMWARGQHGATVRLEHLWHSLCRTNQFSLFCAYPKIGFTEDAASSVEEICAAHSRVISG
ncbi:MAG: MEDS domain-containing protein [Phycisphaerales bacterium]|nr:MEDS domain-containing protein [Phycisphaerales bacterium]